MRRCLLAYHRWCTSHELEPNPEQVLMHEYRMRYFRGVKNQRTLSTGKTPVSNQRPSLSVTAVCSP